MILYITLFLVPVILFVVWKLIKINRYWKDQGILEVKPWPIVGNMLDTLTGTNFADFLINIYNTYDERYFGIFQFLQPALVIKDVDLIKQIMIKDYETFVDHKNFFTESREPVFGENLFALKGEPWRHMRATLSPAFTSSKMRIMFNLIRDCAEQFTDHFVANSKPDQATVLSMKQMFSRFTNDVVATCAFGVTCDSLKDTNNEFFVRGQDIGNFGGIRGIKFTLFSAMPNVMNFFNIRLYSEDLVNFFRNLVTDTIDIREKNNIYRPDMIHLLMEARKGILKYEEESADDKNTAGFATVEESNYGKDSGRVKTMLTDDELAAQVLIFFLAGFDTSSTTLSFLAYELAVNPDIQKKLQQEIDEYKEECKGEFDYEGILRLKYLDMIVTETLRLWTPVYFLTRICSKPYTIPAVKPGEKDLVLKPNDVVWIPSYAIQRDPKHYPNPTKFDPERFNEENKKNVNIYSYLPFGIGPRNCIGSRFALLEIKILLVYLLSKFDLVVVDETNIPPKIDKKQLILATVDGIKLGLKLRKNCQKNLILNCY